MEQLDLEVFLKSPGWPTLSSFAAAVNRPARATGGRRQASADALIFSMDSPEMPTLQILRPALASPKSNQCALA
jgi:hypothetical protein